MDDERSDIPRNLDVRPGQPLIGIPFQDGDKWVTRYFSSEIEADAFVARLNDRAVEGVLSGTCDQSDEEFHAMLDELDRIRHRNPPTPLLDSLP